MCGIAGCLRLEEHAALDTDWVRAASDVLAHRGPDDEGYQTAGDVALSFRRLAILDLSAAAHQPMRSADGRYLMVFNGEIYNYAELGEQLRAEGVPLRSTGDSEVLLETYALSGPGVVHLLRGMYAFAIWDTRRRELFCARDPFGIKPFYYSADGGLLRFASERKALAAPGELSRLDGAALRRYLSLQYVPAPDTLTPPVRVLPPGHTLTARPGGDVRVHRFFMPRLRPAPRRRPGCPQQILAVLRDSVAVHLRSDAPLGAFLSGGVDSAAICALAAEHRPDLLTFTVGFERPGYSEIDRARETAGALGVQSIPYVITPAAFIQHLPQIIYHLDDPMADAAAVPLWFVAREAARHVKVVLSGDGADELFGGYQVYHQHPAVRAAQRLPGWSHSAIVSVAGLLPDGVKGKGMLIRGGIPLRNRYLGNARVYPDDLIDWVAGPGARVAASAYEVTVPVFGQAAAGHLDDTATMQLVDIHTWLPGDILVKSDRMAMAHGLELRVPFLDREVLAVAETLARAEKTGEGTTKLALRQAMAGLLPQAAARQAKLGFPVPVGHWLRDEMYDFARAVLNSADTGQWVNRKAALDLLDRHRKGAWPATWRRVWVLLVFSLWHQIFVERAYDPAALGWQHRPQASPDIERPGRPPEARRGQPGTLTGPP